jgi:hypothetical protein
MTVVPLDVPSDTPTVDSTQIALVWPDRGPTRAKMVCSSRPDVAQLNADRARQSALKVIA